MKGGFGLELLIFSSTSETTQLPLVSSLTNSSACAFERSRALSFFNLPVFGSKSLPVAILSPFTRIKVALNESSLV